MSEPGDSVFTRSPGAMQPDSPLSVPPESRAYAFEFHGQAGEYFRIWIVNLFLTIATLGIYSAWAKVRTQRYFSASTRLADASFDYHAQPLAILKGRILVLVATGLYASSSFISPWVEGAAGIALFLAIPWAITRSLAFRAHNTSWRNIRLHFGAPYGQAFAAYIGLPIVALFSLGILYPYSIFRERKFVVDNASFGKTPFVMTSTLRDFVRAFFAVTLQAIGAVIFVMLCVGGVSTIGGEAVAGVGIALGIPVYFYVFANVASRITNLTYDGTEIGPHRLESNLTASDLAIIYGTNAFAILLSLGLLIPWAQIRMAKVRIEHLQLHATGDLESFAAGQGDDVTSLGSEIGDALGLDIGL